ncbi:hypothetical protein H113_05131 [Trichophyton rubrum MR1459]|uniref:Uncharacterized protein n=1 Tax=Trichophyton rubrum (strain ATCC MYA-4607 / CBS 118892) TaxID=559305 RepID=A0A080WRZ8_TRIRC|nr:uncharacterized protein TERG_11908 [Trichophyton rubrum CBS 118892]EZF94195.1 hypothetical protein H113_05131 [Trichophyton rubrum MR1459]EZG05171.1 hypothetical protein H106_04931 [Trichophyton rubrum CBS 735.88]KFL60978.1 hypothetical protein TERG_11908 [Trichophyton rubrum CBS 118892]
MFILLFAVSSTGGSKGVYSDIVSRGRYFDKMSLWKVEFGCWSHAANCFVDVDKDIRFVDDFFTNELLNNIFECNNPERAMIFTRIIGDQDHMSFAFLEKVNNVKTACFCSGLWKGGKGKVSDSFAIFGIICDQHLDQKHANKVLGIIWSVDRDAGVSLGEDKVHHFFVENSVSRHDKNVFHWDHDAANGLFLQVQNGTDNGNLIRVQLVASCAEILV